jgi:nicotinamidase-related amidase
MADIRYLDVDQSLLLVIDIQDAFTPHIQEMDRVVERSAIMVEAAQVLGLPIIVTEQYPKGLGRTVEALQQSLGNCRYYEKTAFSVMKELAIQEAIHRTGRKQIIIAGIETHVCVSQTAFHLLEDDFQVYIVADAAGSRRKLDHDTALERIRQAGAVITTTEAVIMEMTLTSKHPSFKQISTIIK